MADAQRPGPEEAPSAERRYVTVLFADLVGFTTMSERLDPEEVRELLSHYFDVARAVIERYGGSVEKFIGDAVMAVWGAPVAQEDDPERAVRAALELVSRVGELMAGTEPLQLRAGVASGEAAVTPGRVGEGAVAGDLVNTAARLQSVAPPGFVLVGETTQRATSGAIAYESAGEQQLKGKSAPVQAWRALRVVARVGGAGREEGLEPPFVGREEELRLLKDQLHASEREGRLRMVAITGQAGMGKSRLAWELEKYLDGVADATYYWHQGRSPSYGEGVSFWALGEMVRQRARIAEGESEESTRGKLREALAANIDDPEERRRIEPALGALLGIDQADWAAREQLFTAWRTFFERVADHGPMVLVFEDLQWADNGLLDFIEHLIDWSSERAILVVTLARPELLERRPSFGLGHRALVALRLEPLSDESMGALLHGLVPTLGDDDLRRIVERAEGVPLYAVETVRSLAGTGHLTRRGDIYELAGALPALDVPPTLRALIASRLDGLEPSDRTLLQDASVLGQVFSVRAVAALAGRPEADIEERLRLLAQRELISMEKDPRSPERGRYRFVQGLIREVAYGTLGRVDRRRRHLAAANYFETLGDDELVGVLASHYLDAYAVAPGGAEGETLAAQARVALRAAADRASRLHSHDQAIAYFEQALPITFEPADQVELRRDIARSATTMGRMDMAEEHLRLAIAWFAERGDRMRLAEASADLGYAFLVGSRVDDAVDVLTSALAGLPPDDSLTQIRIHGELARAHMFRAEPDKALTAVSSALEAAERGAFHSMTLQLIITKSWALYLLRRPREATALLLGAMRMADDDGDLEARRRSRFNLSGYLVTDDPHLGLRIAKEGLALSQEYGLAVWVANFAGNAASNALLVGDLEEVMRLDAVVADTARTAMSTTVHGYAAAGAAFRGQSGAVEERLVRVRAEMTKSSTSQDMSSSRYAEAMVAFGEGRLVESRVLARQSRDSYGGGDAPIAAVLAARCGLLLRDLDGLQEDKLWLAENVYYGKWLRRSRRTVEAGALALEGRRDEAAPAYRNVIQEWRTANLGLDLALALLERAQLMGDGDTEAAAGRVEAAEIFAAMGADGLLERLESAATGPRLGLKQSRSSLPEGAAAARH